MYFYREINIKGKKKKKILNKSMMINTKIRITIFSEGEEPAKDLKGNDKLFLINQVHGIIIHFVLHMFTYLYLYLSV